LLLLTVFGNGAGCDGCYCVVVVVGLVVVVVVVVAAVRDFWKFKLL
jgi:hypothetical protein